MQKIIVKKISHRKQRILLLSFPYNEELISICKSIKARYTATHKGWWLPDDNKNFALLFKSFKDKAWLDLTSIEPVATQMLYKTDKETPPTKKGGKLKDITPPEYINKLKRMGYSENTVRTYQNYFNRFLHFHKGSNIDSLKPRDVHIFQNALAKQGRYSISTQRQVANAIKFYFEKVLNRKKEDFFIDLPKAEQKLPIVLSRQEVIKILKVTKNHKHRMMLAVLYSSGLRISELLHLRVKDIDFDRDMILIKEAKGKKDRMTVMSSFLKPFLIEYLRLSTPKYWLIEGMGKKQYSATSVRKVLKRSAKLAGITKDVSPHTLRHSFATHLLEDGTDIRYIQELLEHTNPNTTAIYTHVTQKSLNNIKSPLDRIANDMKLINNDLNLNKLQ